MPFLFNHLGMHGILLEIWQKKKQWLPMLMKWSWYVSSTLKTKQCYYVRNTSDLIFSRLWIWAKHNYCWRVLLYLMRRSWRACPWLTRWRSSYVSSARSTSWLRRRKRSRRYQTWAQVGGGVYSPAVTPPPFTLFVCDVKNSMRSLTFFIICLLSDAQPVWQYLLGNWKASTLPCKYLISGGIV